MAISHLDRLIASSHHQIHKFVARDITERWAFYAVYVPERNLASLTALMEDKVCIDLTRFGHVLASNYGQGPSDETRTLLKDRYGFDV